MKHLKTFKQICETQVDPTEDEILQNAMQKKMDLLNRDLTEDEYLDLKQSVNKNKDNNELPETNYLGQKTKGLLTKNPIGSSVSNAG